MGKVKLYFLTFSWHLFLDFCFCLLNRVLEPLQWTPSFYWSTHICGWLSKSMFLGSMRIGITHFTTLLTSLQASPLILKCGFLGSLNIFKRVDFKALSSMSKICVFSGGTFYWPFGRAAALGLSCKGQNLVPWPGIKSEPPALGAWSLNHWTLEKSLMTLFFSCILIIFFCFSVCFIFFIVIDWAF